MWMRTCPWMRVVDDLKMSTVALPFEWGWNHTTNNSYWRKWFNESETWGETVVCSSITVGWHAVNPARTGYLCDIKESHNGITPALETNYSFYWPLAPPDQTTQHVINYRYQSCNCRWFAHAIVRTGQRCLHNCKQGWVMCDWAEIFIGVKKGVCFCTETYHRWTVQVKISKRCLWFFLIGSIELILCPNLAILKPCLVPTTQTCVYCFIT